MRWDTIALVGVGLIGGSIGLALRQRKLSRRVVGIGRRRATLRRAQERGAITEATTSISRGVADAQLVVVCTPVELVVSKCLEVAEHCPEGTLLTDVGSTKAEIVRSMERHRKGLANRRIRFVGSHPLAGSEKAGPQHARSDLLVDHTVIVTPARQTAVTDCRRIEAFWRSLGARVLRKTPREHDQAVAAISHLPHLIAATLAAATPLAASPLAASGWLDTTRVAAGNVELWRQILTNNRGNLLTSLAKFEKVLANFRNALETGDDALLRRLLTEGKERRDAVGN